MAVETAIPSTGVRVVALSHFTLPVRDRYAAARFYSALFDAEIDHESDPDRVKQGKAKSLQVGVQLCDGVQVDLFEQDFGQPTLEQSHPHHAFEVAPEDVPAWVERLAFWNVPHAGPITRAGTTGAEIYFRDPDGNNLELHCANYPEHAALPMGPFDKKDTDLREWPQPERAKLAEQLLQERLQRMRARKARKS